MVWRLLFIPFILSLLLLLLSLSFNYLGKDKKELYQLIETQNIENFSLKIEKVFYQFKGELDQRRELYKEKHSDVLTYLEQSPKLSLSELKDELRETMGFDVDLSLIDNNYIIQDSTFLPDIGLNFNHPGLSDTQIAFEKASSTNNIVYGHPTQEVVSGSYKLYTLSTLETGGFIQLGFVDPMLKKYFENALSVLQNTAGVLSADLFFKINESMNPSDSLASILHPFMMKPIQEKAIQNLKKGDKSEYIKQRSKMLADDLAYFNNIKGSQYIQIPDNDNPNTMMVYLKLSTLASPTDIPIQYLAKVKIESIQVPWIEIYGARLNVVLMLIIVALMIFAFVEIRMRIVSPLLELKMALELNQEIDLAQKKSLFQEIRYLIQSYNDYRNKNQELTNKLHHSAITDPLTGLYNRSTITNIYDKLVRVALRNNHFLGIAFIDLDHFKEFNDLYGHQAGDDALIAVSDSIKSTFRRPTDAGIRFGGEEFLVFFEIERVDDAQQQVKRLTQTLKEKAIGHDGNSSSELLTMSIGLTLAKPQLDIALDNMIKIADEAVYQAKLQGRNTIVTRNLIKEVESFLKK